MIARAQTVTAHEAASPSLSGVFNTLLGDIVGGRYGAGARLPAERDLARMLGASRATLREALRRLADWRLVETRRGSGVVVRDAREWSLDVLPAYLRHGAATLGARGLVQLVGDLLAVRRIVFLDVLRLIGQRGGPNVLHGGALDGARAAVHRAWAARHDPATFVREDFGFLRAVVEAARFLPTLWLLNDLADVYLGVARVFGPGSAVVPADYVATHEAVAAALERGDVEDAAGRMAAYFETHDRGLLAALGALP